MRTASIVFLWTGMLVRALPAQSVPWVTAGDTARVRVLSGERYQGLVVAQIGDTLVLRCVPIGGLWPEELKRAKSLRYTQQQCRLSLDSVTEVAVLHGRSANPGTGALIGLLVGGVAGGLLGGAVCADTDGPYAFSSICSVPRGVATGFVVFGLGGAFVGGFVGSLIRTERWEVVVQRYPTRRNVTHGLAMRILLP